MKKQRSFQKRAFNKFIFVYIFTVLIFATIYTFMSNQFYYATSSQEALLKKDMMYIKEEIESSIKRNFINYHNGKSIYIDEEMNYIFNINNFKIDKIQITDKLLKLYTTLNIIDKNDTSKIYEKAIEIKINNENRIIYNDYIYQFCEINSNNEMDYIQDLKIEDIFKINIGKEVSNVGVIFPIELNNKIKDCIKMSDGIASTESESIVVNFKWNFPRMLYLSMVTITTLGYGDIVPLTNMARLLIGIESTLGIIILGWFANVIMRER